MRIKDGFTLRTVGDEYIVVAGGTQNVDFTRIISLNRSAARLWKEVENADFTAEDLIALLLKWYQIDEESAREDINILLEEWKRTGIID